MRRTMLNGKLFIFMLGGPAILSHLELAPRAEEVATAIEDFHYRSVTGVSWGGPSVAMATSG